MRYEQVTILNIVRNIFTTSIYSGRIRKRIEDYITI